MSETTLDHDAPSMSPMSAARGGGYYQGDGPPANVPSNLDAYPNAEPRVETPLPGANKPYTVLGRSYVPLTGDSGFRQRGIASWYGNKYHGRDTASGEPYDMYKMTAAHPTLPIPSYARVRHVETGREVIVRINDRGPFHSERIVDLSYLAAHRLGILGGGSATVELERLTHEAIRTGAWRRGSSDDELFASSGGATSFPVSQPRAPAGTQPVRPLPATTAAPRATPAATAARARPGFWVQLGAFSQRDGAERFRQQVAMHVAGMSQSLSLFDEAPLYKLQAGPYRSRQDANIVAAQVRSTLQLTPMVVQRR